MCPLDEPWGIIDQIVLHLLCLPPRLSSQAAGSTNKTTNNNAHTHTVGQRICCILTNKCLSVGISLLTLICPSHLTYEITFLTIGKWSIIPRSLCSMPSGRAFFQKPPTWIHQYTNEMPRFVLPSTLWHLFFHLYHRDILPKQLGLPLSFLECVYFYSKYQESWNIMIKKNWQL